jgi:hypothetical protein
VPNIVNFLMTTNETQPIFLDREDRRHTLVQTTDRGIEASDMVRAYLPPLKAGADSTEQLDFTRDVHGFAALLSLIEIDYAAISRPFMTELRAELLRGAVKAPDLWFMQTDAQWLVGETLSSKDAFRKFHDWAIDNHTTGYKSITNEISFGRQLNWLKSEGYISSEHSRVGSKLTKLKYFSPETETALNERLRVQAAAKAMCGSQSIEWFVNGCPIPPRTERPDIGSVEPAGEA